jgi:uncharacterized protein (DUF885 family)
MYMTRRALLGASAAGAVLIAAGCAPPQNGDLHAILNQAVTDFLRESPEFATSLGVTEEQAGGRYVDRLSDVSRESIARQRAKTQEVIQQLGTVNRANLSAQDSVTLDVVTTALQNNVDAGAFVTGGGAQAPYTVTQLTGAYNGLPDFLVQQHAVRTRDEADAYLTRLAAFAGMLDQETTRIGLDEGDGVVPPGFIIDRTIGLLGDFTAIPPAQNRLVTSFQQKLAALADVPDADKTAMVQRAEAILRDEVLPAYGRQTERMQALRANAPATAGVGALPRGGELYAAALRSWTTTTMAPQEIHDMGVELLRDLNAQMEAIFRANGMTTGTLAERFTALGARPGQFYPNTDTGRTQLLAALNEQMRVITARMPEVCGRLTQAPLEIRGVPPEIQAGAPGGYYQSAALDGSRAAAYYINLRDPRTEWPKYKLPTLTYHEGTPGHHWQIAIQQEAGELPFIRSALLGFSAFAEGWGLYAEQLADEMGMYQTDWAGRLGYLQSAAFRASRLVCDTGLHALGWTRDQAIQSMVEATGNPVSSTTTEIERYCVWPGQACSYMVGRQAINRMRDNARQALGANFDQRGFHDTLLTNGSVPLTVAETLVQQWVATVSGPAQSN